MAKQSKFFRVAVEGDTCDGRTISRQDLLDMAATYNRDTYGARVNMEHLRGYAPQPPFNAWGDVLALKTEEVTLELGGKSVKKLGLFAQIDPTDALVTVTDARQKIYTSIEINPNFANTGKAYLQGLAVTDSPASLGTEILQFAAAQGENNPFRSRKIDPGNFFSAASETKIEWQDKPAAGTADDSFFTKLGTILDRFNGKGDKATETATPPPPPPANDNALQQLTAAFTEGLGALQQGVEAMGAKISADVAALRQDHNTLKASIERTDGDPASKRLPASGGHNFNLADC